MDHKTKLTLGPCNCFQFFAREDQTLRQRKAPQCNICSKLPLNLQDPIFKRNDTVTDEMKLPHYIAILYILFALTLVIHYYLKSLFIFYFNFSQASMSVTNFEHTRVFG